MRIAIDIGGTFTDLVLELDDGELRLFKAETRPEDPIGGVIEAIDVAGRALGLERAQLLGRTSMLIHATTRALNAVLTGQTARTALLVTAGHPDILLFREGGRIGPFDFSRAYPEPLIPRALTFEVPERIGADGTVVRPLDEAATARLIEEVRAEDVEAVAVCLLWSMTYPEHERRVGELLAAALPDIPVTLSHELNPITREYRRACSAAIDASLKPLMSQYLRDLDARLRAESFAGRLLISTSSAGMRDAHELAEAPIHSLGSGPSLAPIAGRHYARTAVGAETAIVADTGGTSYDISLVRRGRIPTTREAWLGEPYMSHMTGFPAVDVKSVGAGGGSIASVDEGGVLHVGPRSAGARPGPVAYGRGGTEPTVTDAALVLGYLDPKSFLGGRMELDVDAARAAIAARVAEPLGFDTLRAAAAIIELATEHMVSAIEDITVNQGIDPAHGVLVGGGGAAGLNAVAIARRLGCEQVVFPEVGAVLSAAGAVMSDVTSEFAATLLTDSEHFDHDRVETTLAGLRQRCEDFVDRAGTGEAHAHVSLFADVRYPHQVWELEVPLRGDRLADDAAVAELKQDFDVLHEELFAFSDADSPIEVVGWRARVGIAVRDREVGRMATGGAAMRVPRRSVYFPGDGRSDVDVIAFDDLPTGESREGPLIIESPITTVVVPADASAARTADGSVVVVPGARSAHPDAVTTEVGGAR